MEWNNNNIDEDKVLEVASYIDKDLLIERICFTLNITKKSLFESITIEEIELLISSILINRGIEDKEQINSLVNNVSNSIISPYKLHNAELAADLIYEYCVNSLSTIYIFADYDCDGINSGYVKHDVLAKLSTGKVILKYPNRSEGYGLNMTWCKEIIAKHTSFEDQKVNTPILVITVDNGITKYKEVELLKSHGIECIITDHHPSKEGEVPDCLIVNPHNASEEQTDECKHLSGCGVAFKVAELVQHKFGIDTMLEYTPYLAITTLSDVMPLTNENLAFIQYGLEIINSENCPLGIKELMKTKSIDVMTANDILWTVAPMINACGRMGNTELGGELFFLNEDMSPKEIVSQINKVNEDRKSITKKAQKTIESMNFDEDKVCIIVTDEYPSGIVGIIAGKVAEKFNKPAIVVTKTKDGLYHGSIRSANGINMVSLLEQLKELELIESYGGHSEACVCGFKLEQLENIQNFFNNTVTEELHRTPSTEDKLLNIDEIITLDHLNDIVYTIVNMFPCDNRRYQNPTFALTDLELVEYTETELSKKWNKERKRYEYILSDFNSQFVNQTYKLSENNPNNICFKVRQDGKEKTIWAWGFADKYINEMNKPKNIHIAGTIDKSFMDKKYTINVMDIMTA